LVHLPVGVVQIRTPAWCLERLAAVSAGVLNALDLRSRHHSLPIACVADEDDLVFVVREHVEQTWSLVWSEVTLQLSGTSGDSRRWVVRANGICERERLPTWAAASWARASHPAIGAGHPAGLAPIALRLREAGLRGYSTQLPEQEQAG
jgi:hypothetical protein